MIAAVCLVLSLSSFAPTEATESNLDGRPVTRIELRSDVQDIPVKQVEDFLALRVGRPFSREALARSLRNLQASGLVGEVEAFARPTRSGAEVVFALWSRVQVQTLRLEGNLEFKQKELRSVLSVREGEPLIESRVLRGAYDLQAYYAERGYLGALVRVRPQVDQSTKRAVVVYEVAPGPRFVVGSVSFDGSIAPLTAEKLLGRLRVESGEPYRRRALRAESERLEGWLISLDYRLARVGQVVEEVDWEAATVDLRFPVEVGPLFHVEVRGADQRQLRKKGLLPFLEEQRFDEAILLQSVARVRRHFQELGHYGVRIERTETRGEGIYHLVLSIEPGPVYELKGIRFVGDQALSPRQLESLMSTSLRRLFGGTSGRLVDETLEDDLRNIHSFYRLEGYWEAEVGPYEVETQGNQLVVVIPIREGSQRRVVDLVIEGTAAIDVTELKQGLSLRAGGPFHPVLLERASSTIRARYEAKGFESTQISAIVEWNREETLADVRFRVLEGPRSVVDRVVVRGNRRTRPEVVRKAISLKPGETFNTSRLLEAQRSLYDLGAFAGVEVRRAPGTPFKGERDILVEVKEGDRHNITYGVGYDTEDGFSGLLGYTRSNLQGRGLSSRLDLRASERDSLARILLHQPYIGHLRLPTTGSLFYIEETKESFTSKRRGGQLGVERLGGHSRSRLLFEYRLVEVAELAEPIGEIEIDRELQEVQIASLTPGWQIDHRNDPVDASQGWSTNLQIEYAMPIFAADEEFLKGFGQYTQFFGLGRFGSIGGSLRLGAIEPINEATPDPTVPGDQLSQYIPISERFFAGGRSTHRAYRRDRLGIPGETLIIDRGRQPTDEVSLVPIGGNGLALLNLDYRFPIAGPVGGNIFIDTGNVWGDWRDFDPSEAKTGVGVGVRYLSPVGPIRVEVGWKLDRILGEDDYVVFFSVGNPY